MLNLFDPKLSGYGQSGTGRHIGRVNVKLEFSFSISFFSDFQISNLFMAGNTILLLLFLLKKHHNPFSTGFQQQVSSCFIIALIDHRVFVFVLSRDDTRLYQVFLSLNQKYDISWVHELDQRMVRADGRHYSCLCKVNTTS